MSNIEIKENKYIDCSLLDSKSSFVVDAKEPVKLTLLNLKEESEINLEVKDNVLLQLSIFSDKPLKTSKITANIGENSKILTYFADFSKEEINLDASINLNKPNANCEWHLASLARGEDKKKITVNIYHNSPMTFGRLDNYGVAKDHSKLLFAGVSHIIKESHQSASHQNAKIMVFDQGAVGTAKPVLKIDENDIEASHAAVVGKISDEHLFYLTSRGLSREEAKSLITLGYLKPILVGFDEEIQKEIDRIIEENR